MIKLQDLLIEISIPNIGGKTSILEDKLKKMVGNSPKALINYDKLKDTTIDFNCKHDLHSIINYE